MEKSEIFLPPKEDQDDDIQILEIIPKKKSDRDAFGKTSLSLRDTSKSLSSIRAPVKNSHIELSTKQLPAIEKITTVHSIPMQSARTVQSVQLNSPQYSAMINSETLLYPSVTLSGVDRDTAEYSLDAASSSRSSTVLQPMASHFEDFLESTSGYPGSSENSSSSTNTEITITNEPPEKEWRLGDLAWARVGKYPFWPCMIALDPELKIFSRTRSIGQVKPITLRTLHVQFFGDKGLRSWVSTASVLRFEGRQAFMNQSQKILSQIKKKDRHYAKAFFSRPAAKPTWELAVGEAERFIKKPRELRIQYFSKFVPNNGNKPNKKRRIPSGFSDANAPKQLKTNADKDNNPVGSLRGKIHRTGVPRSSSRDRNENKENILHKKKPHTRTSESASEEAVGTSNLNQSVNDMLPNSEVNLIPSFSGSIMSQMPEGNMASKQLVNVIHTSEENHNLNQPDSDVPQVFQEHQSGNNPQAADENISSGQHGCNSLGNQVDKPRTANSGENFVARLNSEEDVVVLSETPSDWSFRDLAWARVGKHPIWPCTVSIDPELAAFTKKSDFGRNNLVFQNNVNIPLPRNNCCHNWVVTTHFMTYDGEESFNAQVESILREMERDYIKCLATRAKKLSTNDASDSADTPPPATVPKLPRECTAAETVAAAIASSVSNAASCNSFWEEAEKADDHSPMETCEEPLLPVKEINNGACPLCGKVFDENTLMHHIGLHYQQKFFSCVDCGRNFLTEVALRQHRC